MVLARNSPWLSEKPVLPKVLCTLFKTARPYCHSLRQIMVAAPEDVSRKAWMVAESAQLALYCTMRYHEYAHAVAKMGDGSRCRATETEVRESESKTETGRTERNEKAEEPNLWQMPANQQPASCSERLQGSPMLLDVLAVLQNFVLRQQQLCSFIRLGRPGGLTPYPCIQGCHPNFSWYGNGWPCGAQPLSK